MAQVPDGGYSTPVEALPDPLATPAAAVTPTAGQQNTFTMTNDASTATNDRMTFALAVLNGIGAPQTQANIDAMLAWMQAESGPSGGASFNPMNTTQPASGASNFNSVGVKNYTSFQQGVAATVQTLQNGYYGPILSALRSGSSAEAVAQAVGGSPWGTSGSLMLQVLNSGGAKNGALGTTPGGDNSGVQGGSQFNKPFSTTYNAEQLEAQYGLTAAYFDGVPELKGLIDQAVAGQWDATMFKARLENTQWFKTTSDTARDWYTLQKIDPAQADRRLLMAKQDMATQAAKFGLNLSEQQLSELATNSLSLGWDQAQVNHTLGKLATGGGADVTNMQLKQMAKQYFVPLSDATLNAWAGQTISSGSTDQFKTFLISQAKSLYPTMAPALDAGLTAEQWADPYKQVAAQTLEIDPNTVDFMQPKWNKALMAVDPKTHQRTAMTLSDWTNTLRSDPVYGYDQTANARTEAASLGAKVLANFGFGS